MIKSKYLYPTPRCAAVIIEDDIDIDWEKIISQLDKPTQSINHNGICETTNRITKRMFKRNNDGE